VELTRAERQIYRVGDGRNKNRCAFLYEPGRNRIGIRLFVLTAEKYLDISDSDAGLKEEN